LAIQSKLRSRRVRTLPVVFILFMVGAFAISLSGDLASAVYAQQQGTSVTVTRVVDGDTIEISPAIGGIEDVRLIGADTPETVEPGTPVQPYGPQASSFTKAQLEGKRVALEFDEQREDQYGRLLAYIHVGGQIFNETLLSQGYAQLYIVSPNDKFEVRFRQAQEQARSAERGLWRLPQNQLCQLAGRGNGIGEGSPGCVRDDAAPPGTTTGAIEGQNVGGKDDIIQGTIRKGSLPDTGGPHLLLVPWVLAFVVAGATLLRRS
jgi:micrococcal nuclease